MTYKTSFVNVGRHKAAFEIVTQGFPQYDDFMRAVSPHLRSDNIGFLVDDEECEPAYEAHGQALAGFRQIGEFTVEEVR